MTENATFHIDLDPTIQAATGDGRYITAPALAILNGIQVERRVKDRTVRGLMRVSQQLGDGIHFAFTTPTPREATLQATVPLKHAFAASKALAKVVGVRGVTQLSNSLATYNGAGRPLHNGLA
ncbi:MAG: hypothetical protein HY053_04155 [Proteobacteria bacterium]|nr:hypothetical protein [Pseudomonadota bacterium]